MTANTSAQYTHEGLEIIYVYPIMKRTDSFIHGFQKIDIQLTTNVDDKIMKSLTPPTPGFLMDYFSSRKNAISEDGKPQSTTDTKNSVCK